MHKIYNRNSLSNDDAHFWFCLPKCCYLWIQAHYKVSIKSSMKWPLQTTLFIYWSWGLSLSRSILFFTFWVSQAFQQSTEPVHPHWAQQRPHKQARNKTGFVSWGGGGREARKKQLYQLLPLWSTIEIPTFPALIKFLKGKERKKNS